MAQPIYVSFTMDCERILSESPQGGPESWEMSEGALRGYTGRLLAHGFKPTLFLTPECGERHVALLQNLSEQGVELGMHVHPQSLGDHRYTRYLGEYDAAGQREILGATADRLATTFGRRPVSFRPGNFSASDATYGVLYDLGFRQGSVSDPGRRCPQFAAMWEDAYPDPHYVNPENRLVVGELPFLEFPLTTDPELRHPNGFPYELRVESGPFESWHLPILQKTLARWERQPVEFPTLSIFTHNFIPYDDPEGPRTATLQQLLDYLAALGKQVQLVPVTLQEAHARFQAQRAAGGKAAV